MCCCGHGKYNHSLIVVHTAGENIPFDIFSKTRFRYLQNRFYKRDKKGVYYIPEVVNKK
jgi:hypothetical protein